MPDTYLDPDAIDIVRELQRAGHVSYLVGGCVRDLLLGRRPKDIDVATDATPQELKRLFRNCRIIGRRFRLAHLHFGPKIIEVATFRGRGSEAVLGSHDAIDEVIERTNTFGTPVQDARSRDFTMNALFYDPIGHTLIDYVGGQADIEQRVIRTIGDPLVRLAEDPVRILRAIKFAARLDFGIAPEVRQAMEEHAALVALCPPPRVTEEIFRIAESGHARKAFELMRAVGVLPAVLPELDAFVRTATLRELGTDVAQQRMFAHLDRLVAANEGVPREFVLTALCYLPVLAEIDHLPPQSRADWDQVADEWLRPLGTRMHVPVRLRMRFQAILYVLQRFIDTERRHRRLKTLVHNDAFSQALTLLRMHIEVFGFGAAAYDAWAAVAAEEGVIASPYGPLRPEKSVDEGMVATGEGPDGSRKGRRGGRRRRRRF